VGLSLLPFSARRRSRREKQAITPPLTVSMNQEVPVSDEGAVERPRKVA
jgi:hypothetical protein